MSSPYPVLDNRPIDQWRVTELKEELKRRKLVTKGLKEDLIKRLNEALQEETENDESKDDDNGKPQTEVHVIDSEKVCFGNESTEALVDLGLKNNETVYYDAYKTDDAIITRIDADISSGQDNVQAVETVLDMEETTVETSTVVTEVVVSETVSSGQDLPNSDIFRGQNENLLTQPESDISETQVGNMAIMLDSSIPMNQVSEPILRSDSISTDSISINVTNELKDNIKTDDNVKLELEVIKEKIAEISCKSIVPDCGGESLDSMTDKEPSEKSIVAENDGNNATLNKEYDNTTVGYSEKLNLDRVSSDDSMEDVAEDKQIESKDNSDQMDDKGPTTEVRVVLKEDVLSDVGGGNLSVETEMKDIRLENKKSSLITEKRKINDQEVGNNDSSKRQRRWNTQGLKMPEPQSSSISLFAIPKDTLQSPSVKQKFSQPDSTKGENVPTERIVPPFSKSPTTSLRIDRFVRPFTLKAVQELLGKTGNVTSFWMDPIKTHCYITYSSVEEAIETRNAVYNLQWPPNGGLLLLAEFVDPKEVKMRVDPTPLTTTTLPSPRQQQSPRFSNPPPPVRERLTLPPAPRREQISLPRPPPLLPPPPPLPVNFSAPIVTLDDLFRKTKTAPRIYYLPLSEEQVAGRGKNMKGNVVIERFL